MTITEASVDIATPTGPMRALVFRPAASGKYPGLILFSEIFQITGPIRRTGAFLAGHGYVVVVPEIYHELESAGAVLAYDEAGAQKGNAHKVAKEVSAYDSDARAALDHLKSREDCTGALGVMGICIGGHLAFRAAMNPDVLAAACFYATQLARARR
jgi:carboxymethylenebutenolidase